MCAVCPETARRYGFCMIHWGMLLKPIRERLQHDPDILPGAARFIVLRESVQPAKWRKIHSCEVSSLGQVIRNGRLLPWDVNSSLYPMVTLAKGVRRLVHLLVAEAFLGPKPIGHEIDHRDDDVLNPSAENLSYVTHAQNMSKRRRRPKRLTEAERAEVRRLARTSSVHALAGRFEVSTRTIRTIAREELTDKRGTVAKREACR